MRLPLLLLPFLLIATLTDAQDTSTKPTSYTNNYRQAALDAARWIRSTVVNAEHGPAWPAVPGDAKSVSAGLYHGVAGTLLFFVEVYRTTKDETYLKDIRLGGDYLLNTLESEKSCGLYTGLAGVGFALQEAFKATNDAKYLEGAKRCVQLIKERAKVVGQGVEWDQVTDIIAGSAGTGLFLLYAARDHKDDTARALAVTTGKRLIELAPPAAGGGL